MIQKSIKDEDIQLVQDRFQQLRGIATDTEAIPPSLWHQTLADFSHVLEELQVSNEELKQQNEELQVAHQTLEQQHLQHNHDFSG